MGSGGKDKQKEPKQRKKPGRVPTSCAECRRLKLRCDRNVPCEKCVSRGCGSICPDGILSSGKGGRMILANTEELHEQIEQMAARNRELEIALQKLQGTVSDQPHPLLTTDLRLSVQKGPSSSAPSTSSSSKSPSAYRPSPTMTKHSSDLGTQDIKMEEDEQGALYTFGTIIMNRKGGYNFLGRTARSEYLTQATSGSYRASRPKPTLPRLSKRILEVAFPESELYSEDLLADIFNLLPSHADALHLCDVYLEYGKFLYSPISKNELLEEVLPQLYRAKQLYTSSTLGYEHYHSLALLFIIFALGSLFDPQQAAHPYSSDADEYYYLAKTVLRFKIPSTVGSRGGDIETTLTSIQVLIHMAQYNDLKDTDGDGHSPHESAWILIGEAVRLGYKIGLHLDSTHWNLPDETIERRHALFWRLFLVDTWTSLRLGRPPGISRSHYDCSIPRPPSPISEGGDLETFHTWYINFTHLLHISGILETSLLGIAFSNSEKRPQYATILELDFEIRNFYVPVTWRIPPRPNSDFEEGSSMRPPRMVDASTSMYSWLVVCAKESAILSLHRPFFAQALRESSTDIQRHQYLPSVVASYRAAWRIIHALTVTWSVLPKFLSRVGGAWGCGYEAAVVMCSIASQAPTSAMSNGAVENLENIISLFQEAAPACRAAAKLSLPMQRLRLKAYEVMGLPISRIHHQLQQQHEDEVSSISFAELDMLNGLTYLHVEGGSQSGPLASSFSSFTPYAAASSSSSSSSSSSHSRYQEKRQTRSRGTSVTMSDDLGMGGPGATSGGTDAHGDINGEEYLKSLHPTLLQDIKELESRGSGSGSEGYTGSTSSWSFFDSSGAVLPLDAQARSRRQAQGHDHGHHHHNITPPPRASSSSSSSSSYHQRQQQYRQHQNQNQNRHHQIHGPAHADIDANSPSSSPETTHMPSSSSARIYTPYQQVAPRSDSFNYLSASASASSSSSSSSASIPPSTYQPHSTDRSISTSTYQPPSATSHRASSASASASSSAAVTTVSSSITSVFGTNPFSTSISNSTSASASTPVSTSNHLPFSLSLPVSDHDAPSARSIMGNWTPSVPAIHTYMPTQTETQTQMEMEMETQSQVHTDNAYPYSNDTHTQTQAQTPAHHHHHNGHPHIHPAQMYVHMFNTNFNGSFHFLDPSWNQFVEQLGF